MFCKGEPLKVNLGIEIVNVDFNSLNNKGDGVFKNFTHEDYEKFSKLSEGFNGADINEIIEYGVMSTPAIVIDGQVKSYGKLNDVEEIKEWL